MFPKIENKDDKEWVINLLRQKGVLVVYGSEFGTPEHFRIVFLPPIKLLEEGQVYLNVVKKEIIPESARFILLTLHIIIDNSTIYGG